MAETPDPMDLILFARVANAGAFGEAARQLGLPQSTLSRRIRELEARLGEKVLQRTTRTVVLTEMGQRILGSAELIAHELERVGDVVERRRARPTGRLRMTAPADLAAFMLAPMMAEFSKAFPDVQLDLDLSPRHVDVINESFDLAIRVAGPENNIQLTTRHLFDLNIGLFAAGNYLDARGLPKSPLDLPAFDLLMLTSQAQAFPWTLQKGGETLTIDGKACRMAANSYNMLQQLARSEAGITALPMLFAASDVADGILQPVLPDWRCSPASVHAVFPSRRLMPLKTRAFLDLLLLHVKEGNLVTHVDQPG